MRIAFCNHWYPEAYHSWKGQASLTDDNPPLHGTANFWDIALQSSGHEAQTFVVNGYLDAKFMFNEIREYNPDVLCTMEVGRFPAPMLQAACPDAKLVAFCSHRADDEALRGFGVVFSSFRWMPSYCAGIGVRCEYLPLAFGKTVLDRVKYDGPRDIPVCFIGGLGSRIWDQGTKTMAVIAQAVPEFQWYGYVTGSMSDLPPALQRAYKGEAWGADMYRLLMRTKILVNRHGEIARGFANNCRTYEGPGCGCHVLSDFDGEFSMSLYKSPEMAIDAIHLNFEHDRMCADAAAMTKDFVLNYHTFESRVPRFLEVVENL